MRGRRPSRRKLLSASLPSGLALLLAHSAYGGEVAFAFRKPFGAALPRTQIVSDGSNPNLYSYSLSAGVESLIFFSTAYDAQTCQVIGPGTYVSKTPPQYGTLHFSTINLALEGGSCNGVVIPWAAAYYTWTAGADNSETRSLRDRFSLKWIIGNQVEEVTPFVIQVGPRITLQLANGNSRDITGSDLKVVAGQQVILNAIDPPDSVTYDDKEDTIVSQSWSVSDPEDILGGFYPTQNTSCTTDVKNGCFSQPITNQPTFIAYWTKSGILSTVTYSYTLADGTSGAISTIINVDGIKKDSLVFLSQPGEISILPDTPSQFNHPGTFDLSCGLTGPDAIHCANFQIIAPATGKYTWAQVVTKDDQAHSLPGGPKKHCKTPPGLDAAYPLEAAQAYNTPLDCPYVTSCIADSPNIWLSHYAFLERTFAARMFLMWNAGITDASGTITSIDVPLGSVQWSWQSSTFYENGAWTTPSPSIPYIGPFKYGSTYPTWSSVVTATTACNATD